MPSITYWNRLEPRARSTDLAGALAARIRDPAWLLARQWQLGELRGEDAGSPAVIRVAADVTPMTAWGLPDQPAQPLVAGAPVERAVTAEPFSPDDLSLWVELGQWFDFMLVFWSVADLRDLWLTDFPITDVPDEDPRTGRLRALWKGRVIHGLAVYLAGKQGPTPENPYPGVPVAVPADRKTNARRAVEAIVAHVDELQFRGPIGPDDPAAWRPERLTYDMRVYADAMNVAIPTTMILDAHPDREGDLEWFAFDRTTGTVPPGVPAPSATTILRSVIPGRVRFRGMPHDRFWDFEDGRVDFGGLRPDRRDLASMILMDFMLLHGTDWFLVPFEQPVGTLCRSALEVLDVFGESSQLVPASSFGSSPWSMFAITDLYGHLLLPATGAASVQDGEPLEEVRLLRDETANLAWGIEHATEGHLGTPWSGHERATRSEPPAEPPAAAPLRYRIQTRVPIHWIPLQPVAIGGDQIALERASLLAVDGPPGTPPTPAQPLGKVLQPDGLTGPYRIREDELPREGRRVARLARLARGHDGSTHLWIARKHGVGGGEGWSGLRFDLALPVEVEEPPG